MDRLNHTYMIMRVPRRSPGEKLTQTMCDRSFGNLFNQSFFPQTSVISTQITSFRFFGNKYPNSLYFYAPKPQLVYQAAFMQKYSCINAAWYTMNQMTVLDKEPSIYITMWTNLYNHNHITIWSIWTKLQQPCGPIYITTWTKSQ